MIKKLLAIPVLGLFLLPVQPVQALTLIGDPTENLLANIEAVESVDFSIDLDFNSRYDSNTLPLVMHADIDGVWDGGYDSKIDLNFWSKDEFGGREEFSGSMITTKDYLYFTETNNQWYFIEKLASYDIPSDDEFNQSVTDISSSLQTLLDEGIITYSVDNVDYVNGAMTIRYSYTLDQNKLIDFGVKHNTFTEKESEELRTYLKNTKIGGSFWVDAIKLIPVKLTFKVMNDPDGPAYTEFKLTAVVNSVNEPVKISKPGNAINLEDYFDSKRAEDLVITSFNSASANMDSDGDGVTDQDELSIWHTNVFSSDSDGDGYDDKTEIINGYDPNGQGKLDSDGDGLTDYAEMTIHWTDRYNPDTDGDGYNDGLEIANGYNPNGPGRW